jgi:hypothetical protein
MKNMIFFFASKISSSLILHFLLFIFKSLQEVLYKRELLWILFTINNYDLLLCPIEKLQTKRV